MPTVKDYMELLYRVYMYPARFPAKIFDIFFEKLRFKGVVFDPFAGSGSLALASYLNCYDSVVWDLNPIIHVLVDAGIKVINKYSIRRVAELLVKAKRYGRPWLPLRADYWWPEEVLDIISRIWGFFRDNLAVFNPNNMAFEALDDAWSLFAIIGLYASRKLSYTDDSVPKWYKSKLKVSKVTRIISERSARSLFDYYARRKAEVLREIEKTVPKPQCSPLVVVRVTDAVTTSDYPDKVVGVLTSPPYVQAQEYIRSFSWELKLLGVSEETISKLRKFEIPYRPPVDVEILSDTYYEVLNSIPEEKFKSLLRSYFTNVLTVLEKTVCKTEVNSIIGIFAGEATVRGNPIPIAKIIGEHLTRKFQLEELVRDRLEDKIKRRRLFKGRKNLNPDGIKIEHLVFLQKPTHAYS
jgi:hypothetical protein